MPYQPHTLVTVGGTLDAKGSDDEVWQFGIRGFAEGGGPVQASSLGALALAVLRGPTGSGGGMEGIFADANGWICQDATLKWCKAANIAPDGTYSDEPGIAQGLTKTGAVIQKAPSFCSVAISWTTGKTLGKAVRGRIYPPNYGAGILDGSAILSATQSSILAWGIEVLQVFDTSLATDPTTIFHPYVVSSSGVSNLITGVRVGNLYDTQRRRKDAVVETYVSGGFTP